LIYFKKKRGKKLTPLSHSLLVILQQSQLREVQDLERKEEKKQRRAAGIDTKQSGQETEDIDTPSPDNTTTLTGRNYLSTSI